MADAKAIGFTTEPMRVDDEGRKTSSPDANGIPTRRTWISAGCESTLDGESGWAGAGVLLFGREGDSAVVPASRGEMAAREKKRRWQAPSRSGSDGTEEGQKRRAGLVQDRRSDRRGGKDCAVRAVSTASGAYNCILRPCTDSGKDEVDESSFRLAGRRVEDLDVLEDPAAPLSPTSDDGRGRTVPYLQ